MKFAIFDVARCRMSTTSLTFLFFLLSILLSPLVSFVCLCYYSSTFSLLFFLFFSFSDLYPFLYLCFYWRKCNNIHTRTRQYMFNSLVQSNKALHIKYKLIKVDARLQFLKAMLYSVFCFTQIKESSDWKEGWTFWKLQWYTWKLLCRAEKRLIQEEWGWDWLTPTSFSKYDKFSISFRLELRYLSKLDQMEVTLSQ